MHLAAADTDTIVALATPLGEAGLAVVRISGSDALKITDTIFKPARSQAPPPSQAPSHTLHYGHVMAEGRRVDEVLVAVMRAPRTFTREDVAEISCHGGVFVARQVLAAALAAGARHAQPGEFTRRAFLNGRLDLTQAEAVADLIHARTERALSAANEQLAGSLSRQVNPLRDQFMAALAHVEAYIDFPDEDISPDTQEQLAGRLTAGIQIMERLLDSALEGRVLRRGIRIAIIGSPNAGKSSLLNQLLARERAIVSPVPGTTRDTIEETANIRGYPVVFVDTAGLREATDHIEQEGIRRTRAAAGDADLLLHVLDQSQPLTDLDRSYLEEFNGRPRLLVGNKSDLPPAVDPPASETAGLIRISCLSSAGLEDLKDAIVREMVSGRIHAGTHEAAINARHEDALRRAQEAAQRALDALRASLPPELVATDLRLAVHAIGEIVGKTTTEDLLDSIFSQFCIGK
ncbi:MAG: tRNA uridine-5-carboxymethylaminomethyl(34) synthesis GTPase MnmE [Verrucomicrobiales bacterium]|nr:tRNA uridine-5-carboxymethylaminomethyl(34) synthesis GTPase MnmE [Verrucomicrobiales bacterium]